jgi:hypothetical protein
LIEFRFVRRNWSSVVQFWPVALTYCRSSWQMAQAAGGWSLSAYWVPHVVQMKFGMMHPFRFRTGYSFRFRTGYFPRPLIRSI